MAVSAQPRGERAVEEQHTDPYQQRYQGKAKCIVAPEGPIPAGHCHSREEEIAARDQHRGAGQERRQPAGRTTCSPHATPSGIRAPIVGRLEHCEQQGCPAPSRGAREILATSEAVASEAVGRCAE